MTLATDLLNSVQKSFAGYLMRDADLKRISNRVRDGTDYEDANEYAVRVGELLARAIDDNTQTLAYMSEDVARDVLTPLLTEAHEIVATASAQVQKNMNTAAGIGLEVLTADLDTNRIDGLVNKVASYDTYDQARWVTQEPVVNYSQAVVDQTIRKNAQAHSKAGFEPVIIRKTEAAKTVNSFKVVRGKKYPYKYKIPCKWCAGLEGVYKYKDVSNTGNNVFRRHESCRCIIIYKDANKTINVRTQKAWTGEDVEEIRKRVNQAAQAQEAKNNAETAAHKYEREFKTAENYADAKKYAYDTLGIEYNMLEKANINVLNAMNKEIARIYDKFGNLHDNHVLTYIANYRKRNADFYAAYNRLVNTVLLKGNKISSASALTNMGKNAAEQYSIGFWSTPNAMHSIRHELGHAIEKLYYRSDLEMMREITELRQSICDEVGVEVWSMQDSRETIKKAGQFLSYYGLMDNSEFIAESVASYMSENPKPVAEKVINILLRKGKK